MKKFSNLELQRAVEVLSKKLTSTKRALPIEFTVDGKEVKPVLSRTINESQPSYDDDGYTKEDKTRTVRINIEPTVMTDEDEAIFDKDDKKITQSSSLNAEMHIKTLRFLDNENKEAFIEVPVWGLEPKEIFKAAKAITDMYIAMRNSVLILTATRDEFVNTSTIDPPTGIILADMLANSGRLQQGAVKDIIESSKNIEGSRLNAAISEYNTEKASKNLIEAIGYITATDFSSGLDILIKEYDKIKNLGENKKTVSKSTSTKPVIVARQEGKMETVERRDAIVKKYKSII